MEENIFNEICARFKTAMVTKPPWMHQVYKDLVLSKSPNLVEGDHWIMPALGEWIEDATKLSHTLIVLLDIAEIDVIKKALNKDV